MKEARWKGRHTGKDTLREKVWGALEASGFAVGSPWSRIPNFVGADMAAKRLADLPQWKRARVVKCNPDAAQIAVRLRALIEGKIVYAPVPELTLGFPFVKLDPEKLAHEGVSFELAATSQGFVRHGEPVQFEDVAPLDFIVVGSVAASRGGGRTGKGAGFADLELGIFRELGRIAADAPIVTSVHSTQLVDDADVPMAPHDSALDYVATEAELIETRSGHAQPAGVDWSKVQPDQFETIPILASLRDRLLARAR